MCLEFFKTGLLSVGGGLATLPFLYEMADRYPWFTRAQLGDMIAVSESTPGPMGVNMATYAGYSAFGVPGAVLATFSLVLPSILVILIVSRFLQRFQDSGLVRRILSGLRPASVGLIAAAGFGILKLALQIEPGAEIWISWKALGAGLVLAGLYAVFGKKAHPILFIGLGAAAGLVMGL
ncbi:MAG: chromate transporter [Oscillospiraceae bacterium]|nr:chromate transporter [Oscillospiraceae bacterium]